MIINIKVEDLKALLTPLSAHLGQDGLVFVSVGLESISATASCAASQKTITLPLPSKEEGSATIEFRKIFSLVSSMQDDKMVKLDIDDSKMKLSCGKTRMTAAASKSAFPMMTFEDQETLNIDPLEIKRGIELVASATSKDDVQKVFAAVAIVSDGNTVDVVATNKSRVSVYNAGVCPDVFEVILPVRSVGNLKNDLTDDVSVFVSNRRLVIVGENATSIYILVDAKYPQYKRAMPFTEPTNTITFDKENMIGCLSRINIVANDPRTTRCVISLPKGGNEASLTGLFVSGGSSEITESLPMANSGENINVAYNPSWLQDSISKMTSDTIEAKLYGGALGQIVLKDGNFTSVLTKVVV